MERVWFRSYDPGVTQSAAMPELCLPRILEKTVQSLPGNSATEFFGARMTYRELWDHIMRMANGLKDLGVKPGDRVAIMLPNSPQAIISYYATLWIGAVGVLTNPMYVEREMEHQWNDAGVEYLIALDHLYPKIEKMLPATRIRKVIVTSIKEYLPWYLKYLYPLKAKKSKLFTAVPYDERILNFSNLIKGSSSSPPACTVGLDDLALLQYTGGTTGVSKGVMLTHRNILANVVQIISWVPFLKCGEERFISILPIFHVFGMTVAMNLPLYIGSTCILLPRFEVKNLLDTLQKSKPSLFPGVPTIFTAIVNYPEIGRYDISSIMFCITGSAPMPVEILRKFEKITGGIIIEGYGLTEASPVTHCNPAKGTRKVGSIGIPLPSTDCKIVDMERGDRELPLGDMGELAVRGPQVAEGYWNRPDETAIAWRDGWLYTGDIARMDEDGYVFIVDRKKDMIIAGGFNIYPREIDEVLYEHPKVMDAAAVGMPDPYRGETVKAFVVLKPGESATQEEIVEFCRSRLAAYKVPRHIEFREFLPKTIVGKVARKELRKEASQQAEVQAGGIG